jgi:peptide-methionine (S)-S-oxide reductase
VALPGAESREKMTAVLQIVKLPTEKTSIMNGQQETAFLAGGCFWCLEAVFEQLTGVTKVESGYTGGAIDNPDYKSVCSGKTGHAEVVQVTFDPSLISYKTLIELFFAIHDPTTLNRQGGDVGTQYRSAIFPHSPAQEETARAVIAELTASNIFEKPIVTTIEPFTTFYKAEDYHQGYFRDNPYQPYCQAVVAPKVGKFRKQFTHLLRS